MRNINLITGLPFNLPEIEDITDKLPRRRTWEELPGKKNVVKGVWDGTLHSGFRNPQDIDTIVIHHSGSPEGTLISHAGHHSRTWGAGISYHLSIDGDMIKQTNDLRSFTFHVADNNTYTVGIEVNRDLSKGDLTEKERQLLYAAILTVKSLLPIKHIKGHNELNKTECPCTSMERIRQDIATLENQMAYKQTTGNKKAVAFEIANQILYLANMTQGKLPDGTTSTEGQVEWAGSVLLDLKPFMQERGLL